MSCIACMHLNSRALGDSVFLQGVVVGIAIAEARKTMTVDVVMGNGKLCDPHKAKLVELLNLAKAAMRGETDG